MTQLEILKTNIAYRDQEILDYQINIDNYTRALVKIDVEYPDNVEMQNFKSVLQKNLLDAVKEQTKAKILRDVMQDQVNEILASGPI